MGARHELIKTRDLLQQLIPVSSGFPHGFGLRLRFRASEGCKRGTLQNEDPMSPQRKVIWAIPGLDAATL